MNKLYKCTLGLLTTFILTCCCFSSAVESYTTISAGNVHLNASATENFLYDNSMYFKDTFCMMNDGGTLCNFTATFNGVSTTINQYRMVGCLIGISVDANHPVVIKNNLNSECTAKFMAINSKDWRPDYTSLQCQTEYNLIPISSVDQNYCTSNGLCPSQYTSLECQTEYNLIPISEVTANYCKLNFDLIDPMECPINEGTGAIVRSNLTINNTPYAQNQNINVFIPDFLAWNIAFNDFNTVIEVEGYNADEEYIENVINKEKLTPTNKDFEEMLTGFMTNYFPYLALTLVFLYLARKIFKIFK